MTNRERILNKSIYDLIMDKGERKVWGDEP